MYGLLLVEHIKERKNTMQKEKTVPGCLLGVLDGDKSGYELSIIYFLEIKHGLMGTFPAISIDDRSIFITTDLAVLEVLWQKLPRRDSKISRRIAYVNKETKVGFVLGSGDVAEDLARKPVRLFFMDDLSKHPEEKFRWANGLIGADIDPECFKLIIGRGLAEAKEGYC